MPAKKATPKKKEKGEDVAKVIIDQLNNIQSKLGDLNKRLIAVEKANIQPMEYVGRLSKIEGRLGI